MTEYEKEEMNEQLNNDSPLNEEEAPKRGRAYRIFRNHYGHRRAGWRILFYALFSAVLLLPVIGLIGALGLEDKVTAKPGMGQFPLAPVVALLCVNLVLAVPGWVLLKWSDRRPTLLLGFDFSKDSIKEFLMGFGFGFLHFGMIFLLILVMGGATVTLGDLSGKIFMSMGYFLVVFFLAAGFEEFLLRGYMFQVLCEGSRNWIGVAVFSLAFALAHFWNPSFSFMGGLNIFLCGILFALIYLKTRSLWFVTSMHMAWNWAQGIIFGVNVSGNRISGSLLETAPRGSELISGGAFGAESSIIYTVTAVMLIVVVWRTEWLKPVKAKAEAWKNYPRGCNLPPQTVERLVVANTPEAPAQMEGE
ncbi:MAG: CPBP family intramembrane metalloprotease [bacterium]|nr:CPBP family intramembrane metalloprotease [bacterium]